MVIPFGRYGLFVWPMWSWSIWSVTDMVQTQRHWHPSSPVWNKMNKFPTSLLIATVLAYLRRNRTYYVLYFNRRWLSSGVHFVLWFLPRDAMHKRGLCRHAVSVCLSRSWVASKRIKISSIFFSPSGSQAILVFLRQTRWRYSDVNPPNGASNAGGVGKKTRISGFAAYRSRLLSTVRVAKCEK